MSCCLDSKVKDVNDHKLENRMESFFLAETTKYLYLMFDPDNFLHNTGGHGTVVDTPAGQCVLDTGQHHDSCAPGYTHHCVSPTQSVLYCLPTPSLLRALWAGFICFANIVKKYELMPQ